MNNKALKILNLALALIIIAIVCYVVFYSPNNHESTSKINTDKLDKDSNTAPENIITKPSNVNSDDLSVSGRLFHVETATIEMSDNSQDIAELPDWITLKGTITGSANIARAILKTKPLTPEEPDTIIRKIGDVIEGFTITEIHKDHILLTNGNKTAQLWIYQNRSMLTSTSPNLNTQTDVNSETVELVLPKTVQENYQMTESISLDCDWSVATDPLENIIGLTLENIKPMTPLALVGLKNGDIIRSINNQQLTSFQKTFQVLQKARVQDKLEIEVIRNGQNHTFKSVLQKTSE